MDIMHRLMRDIEDGIKQSIEAVKSKAALVVEKADELTEEGKRQYRLYELKHTRQKQCSALGERLYELAVKKKLTISNRQLKILMSSVSKTDAQIARLEGHESRLAPRGTVKRKPAANPGVVAKNDEARKTVGRSHGD